MRDSAAYQEVTRFSRRLRIVLGFGEAGYSRTPSLPSQCDRHLESAACCDDLALQTRQPSATRTLIGRLVAMETTFVEVASKCHFVGELAIKAFYVQL